MRLKFLVGLVGLVGLAGFIALTVLTGGASLESGCKRGISLDCANLAQLYESGARSMPQDDKKAFQYFGQACVGGIVWACSSLGDFYAQGRTVPVDYARALGYYQQGCYGRYAGGCYGLGVLYRDGHGVAVDLQRATTYFHESCQNSQGQGRNGRHTGHEAGCDEASQLAAKAGASTGH